MEQHSYDQIERIHAQIAGCSPAAPCRGPNGRPWSAPRAGRSTSSLYTHGSHAPWSISRRSPPARCGATSQGC